MNQTAKDSATSLTNLLPNDASRSGRRSYFIRLATVALIAVSVLLVAHAVLLIPTYALLKQEVATRTTYLSELEQTLLAQGDKQASERLDAIRANAAYLGHLSDLPTASGALRLVLAIPRSGIAITGFTFEPSPDGKAYEMRLTGTATTREALRNYDLALSSVPWITSVDLPISAYAQDANIPFTMVLTGTFISP